MARTRASHVDGGGHCRAGLRWAAFSTLVVCSTPGCSLDERQLTAGFSHTLHPLEAGPVIEPGHEDPVSDGGDPDGAFFLDRSSALDADGGSLLVGDGSGCFHVGESGVDDCGDTLLVNADFNRSLAGWVSGDAFGTIAWDPHDSQSARASGSVAVTNNYDVPDDGECTAVAAQCVPATPGARYAFGADVFIPRGQDYGAAALDVVFYDQEGCTGASQAAYTAATTDVVGRWVRLPEPSAVWAWTTSKSMSVRLGAQKPFRNGPVEILFDAVRVTKVDAG